MAITGRARRRANTPDGPKQLVISSSIFPDGRQADSPEESQDEAHPEVYAAETPALSPAEEDEFYATPMQDAEKDKVEGVFTADAPALPVPCPEA